MLPPHIWIKTPLPFYPCQVYRSSGKILDPPPPTLPAPPGRMTDMKIEIRSRKGRAFFMHGAEHQRGGGFENYCLGEIPSLLFGSGQASLLLAIQRRPSSPSPAAYHTRQAFIFWYQVSLCCRQQHRGAGVPGPRGSGHHQNAGAALRLLSQTSGQ